MQGWLNKAFLSKKKNYFVLIFTRFKTIMTAEDCVELDMLDEEFNHDMPTDVFK
jgi:hypothetical protein